MDTGMARSHWLMKSEPESYSWQQLLEEQSTPWDGVRNYQARNNMREMSVGDAVLFYHSGKSREVVGIMKVTKAAYQDPTTDDDRWLAVDVEPLAELKRPVSLAQIKSEDSLTEILLVRNSRLSVMPLDKAAFSRILKLGATSLPR
jgi:predicted RNA-binding protein with PUA-like domain